MFCFYRQGIHACQCSEDVIVKQIYPATINTNTQIRRCVSKKALKKWEAVFPAFSGTLQAHQQERGEVKPLSSFLLTFCNVDQ
jgi:hypothetical protein